MANIMDYLDWRGDLPLTVSPFNEVDGLILAELSFINFEGIVPPPDDELPVMREPGGKKAPLSGVRHAPTKHRQSGAQPRSACPFALSVYSPRAIFSSVSRRISLRRRVRYGENATFSFA